MNFLPFSSNDQFNMMLRVLMMGLTTCIAIACSSSATNETEKISGVVPDSVDNQNEVVATDSAVTPFQESDCTVNFRAYVDDPDASGPTNVRATPGGKIVLELDPEIDAYIINAVGASNGWFKVEGSVEGLSDSYSIPGGIGWIHGSVLAVDTRNYGGQILSVYNSPDENSPLVATIAGETHLRIKDSCDIWTKVEGVDGNGKAFTGWILNEWLCGNPVTTCA
jgi:hypothetical protein